MTLTFAFEDGSLAARPDVLAVDGVFGVGPNLSHWPGNRTPARYRDDLSTGMALRLAADPGRAAFLRGVSVVANNHYDTDGVCSVFAVLHPEAALAAAGVLLAAAAAGDFEIVRDARALAFDTLVARLSDDPRSPLAATTAGMTDAARHAACMTWLIDRMPGIACDPTPWRELWHDTVAAFERGQQMLATGDATVERHPRHLTVIRSPVDLPQAVLITAAVPDDRVLFVVETDSGTLIRFVHTTRSWFELAVPVPPRFPLEPIAAAFNAALPPGTAGHWIADSVTNPTAHLAFGLSNAERSGFLDGVATLLPCPTSVDIVVAALQRAAIVGDAAFRAGGVRAADAGITMLGEKLP